MNARQIQRGKDFYDPENEVFPRIAKRIKKHLKCSELALILRWKLGRFKTSDKGIIGRIKDINNALRMAGLDGGEIRYTLDQGS